MRTAFALATVALGGCGGPRRSSPPPVMANRAPAPEPTLGGLGADEVSDRVPVVRVAPAGTELDGEKAVIRAYVKRNVDRVTACYERALVAEPELTGEVVATFTVEPDGRVSASTATGVAAGLAACVAGAIAQIRFPPRPTGGRLGVKHPFVFGAAD